VRLLLDTHIALWAVSGDKRLTKQASSQILDPSNDVFVSAASIWEISIKHSVAASKGRSVIVPGRKALELFEKSGFELLPVSAEHAASVDDLPMLHGDPFDRMIVAQALAEPMRLMTHDALVKSYSDTIILV
jgi:PIN domain nuclease of toxin-antitoxin system